MKKNNQNSTKPMKKLLFSASVLLCMTALTKAQDSRVGINTTTPAATLDVTAKPADTALPDGLLVPRMTLTELKGKDAAYANGATALTNQNGTLVFVTDFSGGTTAKTVNVTSSGFYYYDAPNAVWVKVGAGAAPVEVDGIIGNEITSITAGGGNAAVMAVAGTGTNADPLTVGMNPSATVGQVLTTTATGTVGWAAPTERVLNVTSQTNSYTALPTDDIILLTTTGATTLTLPTVGVPIGKKLYVSILGTQDVTVLPTPREIANLNLLSGSGAILVYTGVGATPWSVMTGY